MTHPAIAPTRCLDDEEERSASPVLEGVLLGEDAKPVHIVAGAATILNVPYVELRSVWLPFVDDDDKNRREYPAPVGSDGLPGKQEGVNI